MDLQNPGRLLISTLLGCICLLQPDRRLAVPLPDTRMDGAIEEILVTARRRDEASIAVPMALTRINGATLDGLQYHELDEFLSLSPGVLVYQGGDGVGSREVSGTVNFPSSDLLRLRATGWYEDSNGGYYESKVADRHLDASHQAGGRLALAVLPDDDTSLTLTGEYVDINQGGFPSGDSLVKGAPLGPVSLGPGSRRNVLRDDLGGTDQDSISVTGKLDVDTRVGTVVAVAGWRRITARQPDSTSNCMILKT